MMEQNRLLQLAINNVYKKIKDLPYGEKISWQTIERFTEIPKNQFKMQDLYYITSKVSLLMFSEQKCLITEHGYGKRIIKPDEHILVATNHVRKSVKLYKKAGTVLASTNTEFLNDDQKKEVTMAINKYATLEMFVKESIKKKAIKNSGEDITTITTNLALDALKIALTKKNI